jgi:hypothetical protein
MSANADVLLSSGQIGSSVQEVDSSPAGIFCETNDWNPGNFAREQIRGLVQRVFFSGGARAVKQVVFSAVGSNTDVANICEQVGQILALETSAHIAIVGRDLPDREYVGSVSIKSWSTQIALNLWHVPGFGPRECGEKPGTDRFWHSCLADLRSEFDYAVIQAPAAEASSEAALLGRLADGIILVLGAHSTRKATARKVKETLEATRSRILGTVLSERRFPVPESIYRRL